MLEAIMISSIITMLEDLLERDSGTVNPDDKFREYEEWDSLAYLSVIARIDEDFGFVIPREDFQKIITVNDLAGYLESHQ